LGKKEGRHSRRITFRRATGQNVAEFWINFQGKFVHIRYFAVRDDEGKYLGTVELTQDLGPLRQLCGERRLLAYVHRRNQLDFDPPLNNRSLEGVDLCTPFSSTSDADDSVQLESLQM
jgi:hypothetical protein